jgi:hypothetical protein
MRTIILAANLAGEKCTCVEEAEANAIWNGLKIAIDNNLNLESDCSAVVSMVNNTTQNSSSFWHVYKNISLPRMHFQYALFAKLSGGGSRACTSS